MKRVIMFKAWNHKLSKMSRTTCGVGLLYEFINDEFDSCEWKDIELLQYTELDDKNGNQIYDGDVVKISGETKIFLSSVKKTPSPWYKLEVVSYDTKNACFAKKIIKQKNAYFGDTPPSPVPLHYDDMSDYEIVGNIYENKDF